MDINKLDNSQNEHVSEIFIEMEPADNDNWREQTGVYRQRTIAPSAAGADRAERAKVGLCQRQCITKPDRRQRNGPSTWAL